ncbi:hypothetical protein OHA77_33580 [Streptosporangium sp. NBC_01639]|uniref:hypothetical protein n=1 Tax=Streptosporangium sp. NBC_01639 TaxID=2975948 RepID=UPI00386709F2|nr:hypothetical protein OHA77_33580 [Streptosporangium sp. NBC_01639]
MTTIADPAAAGRPDLIGREFQPGAAVVDTRRRGDITSGESHQASDRVQVELSAGDHPDITGFV